MTNDTLKSLYFEMLGTSCIFDFKRSVEVKKDGESRIIKIIYRRKKANEGSFSFDIILSPTKD